MSIERDPTTKNNKAWQWEPKVSLKNLLIWGSCSFFWGYRKVYLGVILIGGTFFYFWGKNAFFLGVL
jgi:hypothetical protein